MASVTKIQDGDLLENIQDGKILDSLEWQVIMNTIKTAINNNADALSGSGLTSVYYIVAKDSTTANYFDTKAYFNSTSTTGTTGTISVTPPVFTEHYYYSLRARYPSKSSVLNVRTFKITDPRTTITNLDDLVIEEEVYNNVTIDKHPSSVDVIINTKSTDSTLIVIQGVAL